MKLVVDAVCTYVQCYFILRLKVLHLSFSLFRYKKDWGRQEKIPRMTIMTLTLICHVCFFQSPNEYIWQRIYLRSNSIMNVVILLLNNCNFKNSKMKHFFCCISRIQIVHINKFFLSRLIFEVFIFHFLSQLQGHLFKIATMQLKQWQIFITFSLNLSIFRIICFT